MDNQYIIETKNLSKVYADREVVKSVNMHIEKGDIYGFVGENGAGKTTILRMLCNLSIPTYGTFSIYGVDFKDTEIRNVRKKMGAIIEMVALNPDMTALENLKAQCILTSTVKSDEELINAIEQVGLKYNEVSRFQAKNFSLGMRQRLGLAMAMISDPEIILLDEPMNGLDPQGIIDMRNTIINLNEAKGVTFLISSHILTELDKVCNRIGIISRGRLLEEISMDDLHAKARKKLCISANSNNELANVLIKDLGFKEVEVTKNEIRVYDELNLEKVLAALSSKGIEVRNFSMVQESIEDYYLEVIGKGNR